MALGTPVLLGSNGAAGTALTGDVPVTLSRAFAANALGLVGVLVASNQFDGPIESDVSVSGGQTTWDLVASVQYFGTYGFWVFRAMGAAPSGTTVTVNWNGVEYDSMDVSVVEVPGALTTGVNGADAILQAVTGSTQAGGTEFSVPMLTLSDVEKNAFLLLGAHWRGTTRDYANWGIAPGYGWTELHDSGGYGASRGGWAYEIGETATDPSIGYQLSGGTTWLAACGMEIVPAPPTVVTHTIREDGTGDYTSLAAWQTAQARDLVAANEIARAQIEGPWTSPAAAPFTLDGWTTSAECYIEIEPVGEARHTGQWTSTAFRFETLSTGSQYINIQEAFVRWHGLQIHMNPYGFSFPQTALGFGGAGGGGNVEIHDPIIRYTGNASNDGNHIGISFTGIGDVRIFNPLIYGIDATGGGTTRRGISSGTTIGTKEVYNATIHGCLDGFYQSNSVTPILRNCVGYGNVTDFTGSWHATSSHNASEDGTHPGANGLTLVADPFEDSTNDDYRPAAGSVLIDAGVDLSVDFSTDIVGTTRPQGSAWDIGAFELASGGGGTVAPEDLAVATSIDTPALTQSHVLSVQGLTCGVALDAPALTQANVLAPADMASASEIEAPALTQGHVLAPAGLAAASSIDSPALIQAHALLVAALTSGSLIDSPTLSTSGGLSVAGLLSATGLDAPALTQDHVLAPAELLSGASLETVALTQAHVLAALDLLSQTSIESPALSLSTVLAVADLLAGTEIDVPALIQAHLLAPAGLRSVSLLDVPALTQAGTLTVEDLLSATGIGDPTLLDRALAGIQIVRVRHLNEIARVTHRNEHTEF